MKIENKDKVILGLIIVIFIILANNHFNKEESMIIEKNSLLNEETIKESNLEDESKDEINTVKKVHISGEINKPGVYVIDENFRLEDLVNKAGGLTDQADINKINLAMLLEDQMRIIIPNVNDENFDQIDLGASNIIDSQTSDKININTANKEQLMTLPNIGDKRADSIIEYRENQKFEQIEDIKNVSGIGEKYFEQMKDLISTN